MIPGEMFIDDGEIEINAGRETVKVRVANSGDRPIQVGSEHSGWHRGAIRTWPGTGSGTGGLRRQTRGLWF